MPSPLKGKVYAEISLKDNYYWVKITLEANGKTYFKSHYGYNTLAKAVAAAKKAKASITKMPNPSTLKSGAWIPAKAVRIVGGVLQIKK